MRPGIEATEKTAAKKTAAKKPTNAAAARAVNGAKSGKVGGQQGLNDNNVGNVLRSVYQKAVDEDIPAEMLDLLSKLD
jgi:hypothetical protein